MSDDQPETIESEHQSREDVKNGVINLASPSESQSSDTTFELGLVFGKIEDESSSDIIIETTDTESISKSYSEQNETINDDSSTTLDEISAQSSTEQVINRNVFFITFACQLFASNLSLIFVFTKRTFSSMCFCNI